MKHAFLIAFALSLGCTQGSAQTFRFRPDGTFKVLQLTDTHYAAANAKEKTLTLRVISEVVAAERPDLIVHTGDIVTEKTAAQGWTEMLAALEATGVPYVLLNGNHDTEQDLTYAQLSGMIAAAPHSVNRLNERGELTDQTLEILSANASTTEGAEKVAAVLYCVDSHSDTSDATVGSYDWIHDDQIRWFRSESARITEAVGHTVPSMVFYHIPVQEYAVAHDAVDKKGDGRGLKVGIRLEHECPSAINSGFFAAMHEVGGVMANFVGHDHDNDYIARHYGTDLGYGRFSGGRTTYCDLQPCARIITLREGESTYSTYIHLLDGRIIDRYDSAGTNAAATSVDVASSIDLTRWMGRIADATPLRKLSIPATHDSGSRYGSDELKCHTLSIADQLQQGIRAFDIRLIPCLKEGEHRNLKKGDLGVYHYMQYMDMAWEADVLPTFKRFLDEHPTECLIVSLKYEGGWGSVPTEQYTKALQRSLLDKRNAPYFVSNFSNDITLGQCRGKILFVHRDDPVAKGTFPGVRTSGWQDNVTCDVTLTAADGTQAVASIEDEYGHRYVGKAPYKTQTTLNNAFAAHGQNYFKAEPLSGHADKWHISFASATAVPTNTPADFARMVNPALYHELQEVHAPLGIILLDFPENTPGLVSRIISTNF